MNASDKILDDIMIHNLDIQRVSAGLQRKAVGHLIDLEKALVQEITLLGDGFTDFKRRRLTALLEQTRETIKTAYGKIKDTNEKDLERIAQITSKKATAILNTQIGVDVVSVGLSPTQLESLSRNTLVFGKWPRQLWNEQNQKFAGTFAARMRDGYLRGSTVQELIRSVRGTRSALYTDGIMVASKREAETMVRTSIQTISNEARLQTYEKNQDLVKGIQWVSTLDSRTSKICISLDGLQWDNNKKPIGHNKRFPGPTAHINCRSTQISILKSWEEIAGVKVDQKRVEEKLRAKLKRAGLSNEAVNREVTRKRAAIDGNPADAKDFKGWLETKDVATQKKLLGPGRLKLWKEGKINLHQLTDQRGRELTLRELEARNKD